MCYEYIDSWEILDKKSLLSKEKFLSKLKNEIITIETTNTLKELGTHLSLKK